MSLTIALRLLGGVILLGTNAFFVATEFALTRLRQYGHEDMGDDPRLERAWEMTEKLEIYLTGCQVGITFSTILLGIIAEPALTEVLHPLLQAAGVGEAVSYSLSITLAIVFINMAHTVWAEQTPTYLGIEQAKRVARFCTTPHYYWTKVMYPFIIVGDWITKRTLKLFGITMSRSWKETGEDEDSPSRGTLKEQISEVVDNKGLPKDRQEEIVNTFEMGEIPVKNIMIPRDEVVYLSTQKNFEENLAIIRETMKNRYPLAGRSLDDFIGVLYTPEILARVKELQNGEIILDDLDHYNMAVPANLNVSGLIDRFQSNKQELALVKNEEKVIGLVTLTDALEVIIGSAEDPMDE